MGLVWPKPLPPSVYRLWVRVGLRFSGLKAQSGVAGCMVVVRFVCKKLSPCFPERLCPFPLSPALGEWFSFPTSTPAFGVAIFISAILISRWAFSLRSLMVNGVEHLFTGLFATWLPSSVLWDRQHSAESIFCQHSVPFHWNADHVQTRLLHSQVRCLDATQPRRGRKDSHPAAAGGHTASSRGPPPLLTGTVSPRKLGRAKA